MREGERGRERQLDGPDLQYIRAVRVYVGSAPEDDLSQLQQPHTRMKMLPKSRLFSVPGGPRLVPPYGYPAVLGLLFSWFVGA